ncbi:unnamed protein product, partial [marine sediment metagenome]
MINREKVELCAENIVNSINIKKKGECVFIKGGIYSQDLLEEIALNVFRRGGIPHISSTSDHFTETFFLDKKISSEILAITPKHYLKLIENIDAYIVIEPYEDPSILNEVPREKMLARAKALSPIKDVLYGAKEEFAPGKKWCYAGWPSQKAATFYNISYDLLEKFIVGGISVPQKD